MTAAQQAYFSATALSQYRKFNAAQRTAASGQAMVEFLRGRRGLEFNPATPTSASSLFRPRAHLLGDIVNAQTAYVREPVFTYIDSGYMAYRAANASRQAVVYAAANDGMLHAFNANSGQEMWAYVPSMVMPNLSALADLSYTSSHRYSVDGSPVVGDIKSSGVWSTILVGGLNAGGRGYYALQEWGYKPGVVRDVIAEILQKEGPLSKEDVVDRVLKERFLKKNSLTPKIMIFDAFNSRLL